MDRLVGTARPDSDAPAQPASSVRAALLAVGAADAPYTVAEEDDGDLVARWRVEEPAWKTFFVERNVNRTIAVTMRLDEGAQEVRHVTEQLTVTTKEGVLSVSKGAEYTRGNSRTASKRWTVGGDGVDETFSFDSTELTRALERTCLEQGWTWKGVIGRL